MLPIRGFDSTLLVTGPPCTSAAVTELHRGTRECAWLLPTSCYINNSRNVQPCYITPPSPNLSWVTMRVSLPCKFMCLECNTFTTVWKGRSAFPLTFAAPPSSVLLCVKLHLAIIFRLWPWFPLWTKHTPSCWNWDDKREKKVERNPTVSFN